MDWNEEKVIEKVQKLLRLSKSENAGEAAAALARAQYLMAKFNVSVDESFSSDEDVVEKVDVSLGTKSVSSYQARMAKELSTHFGCRILINSYRDRRQSFLIIGTPVSAATFKECLVYAYSAYKRFYGIYLKTKADQLDNLSYKLSDKTQIRDDYFRGFLNGMVNELIRSENEFALTIIVPEVVDKAIAEMSTGTINMNGGRHLSSEEDMMAGYNDGKFAMSHKNKAIK